MNLALVESIEAHGSAVYVRAPVQSIIIEDGCAVGVELVEGSEVRAPMVVSAIGYRNTYTNLVPPEEVKKAGVPPLEELHTKQASSFVMANVALKGSAEELKLRCSNLWVQPSDLGNGYNVFEGIEEFLKNPLTCPVENIPMMITFPSVKDRLWAEKHPGHECAQILVLADMDWFIQHLDTNPWARNAPPHLARKDQEGYDHLKKRWSDRLMEVLLKFYPQLKDQVAFCDISTPLTIEHYLPSGVGMGSAVGLDVTPERFVDIDTLQKLDMKSPIQGLWLTGQDVLLCGVPMAQAAGLLTACRAMGLLNFFKFGLRAARLLLPTLIDHLKSKPKPKEQ